jgi:hypothetical protein
VKNVEMSADAMTITVATGRPDAPQLNIKIVQKKL